MIGLVKGTVYQLTAPTACILTTSGIGYEIEMPIPSFCQLQQNSEITIWTHLHVREDAQLLYGFINQQDRDVFRQLIKINGVGAKMALAMLSNLTVTELKQSVQQNSETTLTKIPGIGKKTAQRLLIELKDKLKNIEIDDLPLLEGEGTSDNLQASDMQVVAEVEAALISLGYREKEAQQAIKQAKIVLNDTDEQTVNTQTLLKLSLKQLA